MKKRFLILSTIVLMLVFISTIISCNSTSSNGNNGGALIPLKKGNSWTYQVKFDLTNSSEDTVIKKMTSVRISDRNVINGNTYFKVRQSGSFHVSNPDTFYVRSTKNGLYIAEYPDEFHNTDETTKSLVGINLITDLEEKEMYTSTDKLGRSYGIQAYKDTVETPAGSFPCRRYHLDVPDFEGNVYISPKVGIVRINEYDDYHDGKFVYDAKLSSYKLN